MAPTIVLIPGAWHPKETFASLADHLKAAGFPVEVAQLASVGGFTTRAEDTAHLQSETIEPLLSAGKNIVLLLHSYAGFVGSPLLRAGAKQYRQAQGKHGGIIGVIFMAAFIVSEGMSVNDLMQGNDKKHIEDHEKGIVIIKTPIPMFYHDVPEKLATETAAMLKDQSLASFATPAGPAEYKDPAYDGRRAYIKCTEDQAISVQGQEAMIGGSGVDWDVKEVKASHAPYLSATVEVTEIVIELSKRWSS